MRRRLTKPRQNFPYAGRELNRLTRGVEKVTDGESVTVVAMGYPRPSIPQVPAGPSYLISADRHRRLSAFFLRTVAPLKYCIDKLFSPPYARAHSP
jgi:hypothetical protein